MCSVQGFCFLCLYQTSSSIFFFFKDRAPPEISPLPHPAALPIPEGGDLGGAQEGEVLGQKKPPPPLAGEAVLGEGLERVGDIARHHARERELRKTLADAI